MVIKAGPLPFAEAVEFFQGKVNLPTARWDDLRHGAHVRAFSVAGMMRDDWLGEVRTALEKARASGGGLAEFQKDFDAFVARSGWQFNAKGTTDDERRAWRARIIYKTNARVAYMAGRYKQMTDPDVLKYRPYWQYQHSGAQHPRKAHLAWDGLVLEASSPWWDVHFPPNGWGCGCDVIGLNKRQLAALGKSGPDPTPDGETYESPDPRTHEPEIRYPGIDRGWEYNPGKEWLHGIVPKERREPLLPHGTPPDPARILPPLPAPKVVAADRLLPKDLPEQEYADRFLAEFGIASGGSGFFRDKSNGIISLSEGLFHERKLGEVVGLKANKNERGQYILLLAEAMADPDEIWADWSEIFPGGPIVLKRAYIKRFTIPGHETMFLRFEWMSNKWVALTAFQGSINYGERYRVGALLYSRE